MEQLKVALIFLPEVNPCGPQATCCGPIGQSKEMMDTIKSTIEQACNIAAELVDIQTIDTEDPEHAIVIKTFNALGTSSLPIITVNKKPVCMASVEPSEITAVLIREIATTRGRA